MNKAQFLYSMTKRMPLDDASNQFLDQTLKCDVDGSLKQVGDEVVFKMGKYQEESFILQSHKVIIPW